MEMWVMTLAGPVTRPGHAGVPVTVTPPRPAPAPAQPPVRCSVAATWTGLPETSSGNCCWSQDGNKCLRFIAFLSSRLLWTLNRKCVIKVYIKVYICCNCSAPAGLQKLPELMQREEPDQAGLGQHAGPGHGAAQLGEPSPELVHRPEVGT